MFKISGKQNARGQHHFAGSLGLVLAMSTESDNKERYVRYVRN